MVRQILLAAFLTLSVSGAAIGQEAPAPCELTTSEKVLESLAAERLVQMGDMAVFEAATDVGGCAVWTLRVNADGTVAEARMVRGEPESAHERVVGAWLATARFRPQPEPWTAVSLLRLDYSESEAPEQ